MMTQLTGIKPDLWPEALLNFQDWIMMKPLV